MQCYKSVIVCFVYRDESVWYPNKDDLGIDHAAQARIANVVLDRSIEIPPSGRSNAENYRQWNTADLLAYGDWLITVLGVDTEQFSPLKQWMIARASKLNIGPADSIIYDNDDIGTMTNFNRLLGLTPRIGFAHLTKQEIITDGQCLTDKYGRLTRPLLAKLSREGKFMGEKSIRNRFGSIALFHEYTGRPSARGWTEDDYIDWGVAFYTQNPDTQLDRAAILTLSRRQVGPSDNSVQTVFGGIIPFRERVQQAYEAKIEQEDARKRRNRSELKELTEMGELPEAMINDKPESEQFRVLALYKTAGKLLPNQPRSVVLAIAKTKDPDAAARRITHLSGNISVAEVEIVTEELGVYEDIWPAERFENVDLRLQAA